MNFSLWHFFGAPPINSPAFSSHFSGKRGAPGGNGAEKCAGRGRLKKNPGIFSGGTGTPGTFPSDSQKILRGGGIPQEELKKIKIPRGFPGIPEIFRIFSEKSSAAAGFLRKKWKYSGFPGPPGARPGGGPGGPPKIATSRRIPHLRWSIKARTPDLAPAGTERRKTAAAWETDHATFPFGTFLGRRLSIPRLFSRTFPEKGGRRGATGRKSARDAGKIKKIREYSRGGLELRGHFPRIPRKSSGNPPRRWDSSGRIKTPRGFFRNSRNFPDFLRKILRGGGISQEK